MASQITPNRPPCRQLRGYAFDPITSLDLDTAEINQIIYSVPWEDNLEPGPVGEYIAVIDRDPASDAVYEPVDLNHPSILAADGLAPSETNPQFHQQMVYAVIMCTIRNFEKALGRKVIWSPVQQVDRKTKKWGYAYVQRLLVYPHAVRDQNAYYSPERKALLFGYYNATPVEGGTFLPGGIVYSCLSHDIIAHETTHALLDGIYSRFMEVTHPDMAGFHEGFSDIVALLQHFTYPEIVKNQIRKTRGALDAENLLGKLAVEFGQSTGEYSSLRDSIGYSDENGKWIPKIPKTSDYEENLECHDRGALLVSAVFDAFLAIYKSRTADLFRIATAGTGDLPAGDIHPDLVARLADEASKAATHVLNMCIRALDYCPPVDLTYGDYLRALITADKELVANDSHHYRIAFINAFRKRGIFPEGVPNLSVDTLCYDSKEQETDKLGFKKMIGEYLRAFKQKLAYQTDRRKIFEDTQDFIRGNLENESSGLYAYLHGNKEFNAQLFEDITGLVMTSQFRELGINESKSFPGKPAIQIQSLQLNTRSGPDGNVLNQIIMTMVQSSKLSVQIDPDTDKADFVPWRNIKAHKEADAIFFRAGCTLIFDLNDLTLRHAISKPYFDYESASKGKHRKLKYNKKRLDMHYRCMLGDLVEELGFAGHDHDPTEMFAAIHQAKNAII